MRIILFFTAVAVVLAQAVQGQTLLSLNQPVTASSYQNGNYPVNGDDGSLATRWAASSAGYPQWWTVDLGSIKSITRVVINWYSSSSRAYQYQIQISDDGTNYTVLANDTGNETFGDTTNNVSAAARYVRIYVTGCSDSSGYASFYECQIQGGVPMAPTPYTPDSNTLFLFHFDEPAGASVTTNAGTLGGNAHSVSESVATTTPPVVTNVLGAPGYTGFGNAAAFGPGELIGYDYNNNGAYDGDAGPRQLSADSLPMSALNMGNGGQTPWTIEAMIRPSAINTTNQEIISTDSSASSLANRGFQFRINYEGDLELNLIAIPGADLKTPIPTAAADPINGFVPNHWYHVAATYDGTNVVLYWTKMSAAMAAANPISTNAVAVGSTFGAVRGPLVIGNENRNIADEYFQGLIDEVRISDIARSPTEMLNLGRVPTVGSPCLSPTNNPVYAGTVVTLSDTASGSGPLSYSWQSDGASGGAVTNIPGANTNRYSLDTASLPPGAYRYDLVVTNIYGSVTSSVVTLNLAAASGPVLVGDTAINPAAVYSGGRVNMSASFTGTEPIGYQWYQVTDGVTNLLTGATNATYSIASAQVGDTGNYFLAAFNHPPGLGSQTMASTPASLTVMAGAAAPLAKSGMFCDLLEHPAETVISDPDPQFDWVYTPVFRDDYQTGYQIIVASSQALADAGTGDLWNSGLVTNSDSINVPYGGAPLQPDTSYFWRVRTMDSKGRWGAFSAAQQFNMASTLSSPLTTPGVFYQQPNGGSTNCYPLRFVGAGPVLITNTAPGDWFIDFGQDAFGYATVHLNGAFSGTAVQATFGEMASNNAVIPGPSGSYVRYGTTSFNLQNGDVTYEVRPPTDMATINPPASYGNVMPFRYVELTGCPGALNVTDVVQERLGTEFDTNAASFNSSSPALNQVWRLCRDSMEWLSFDGIYVDGDRERKPYEADTYIHQLSSYAVDNNFTAPRCSFEYLTTHPTWPTEWKFHMIMIAWADYLHTGNPYLLDKYYSTLQHDSFTWRATGDGLMKGFPNYPQTTDSDIVDWPAADRDGFVISSGSYLNWTNAVNNAFYYHCLRIMAKIAEVTGHTNDAATYTADANTVYQVYNSTFWDRQTQSYVDGVGTTHSSAHANFFPLAFGLVPASNQVAVVNFLHSRIAAHGGMPCSVYGAQYLEQALFEAGDSDTALGLMTTNGPRSWMNMINLGSTLTDEAWNFADKPNEDWNHAWGAAAGNLIARYVLGLQPLSPGCSQILIQPHLGRTLSYVEGTIPTIRGPVSIQATKSPGQFRLLVNVPGNVTATVVLPTDGATRPNALVDGRIVSGNVSNDWLIITNIGSGQHALWLNTNSSPSTAMLYSNWTAGWFGTNANNAAVAGPTADPDGDGADNYSEFIAGTDPLNPADYFHIEHTQYSPVGPRVVVSVAGRPGRHYTLQQTLALAPASWIDVGTQIAGETSETIQLSDSLLDGATQAFLRVMVGYP